MRKARRAGFSVELVPHSTMVPGGYWLSALNINGFLCEIQIISNAQSRDSRRQIYAHTGVTAYALHRFEFILFYLAVTGFKRRLIPLTQGRL
jgi:hypothetical protein